MTLEEIRQHIDALDAELVDLFCRRSALVLEAAEEKRRQQVGICDSEREAAVLDAAVSRNRGPISDDELRHLFREVINVSCAMQERHRA